MAPDRVVPRWEWRTFGDQFGDVDARIQALPHHRRTSRETYIVSATSGANVKIRAGLLDVKQILNVADGLELWTPVLKAPFPVPWDIVVAVCGAWRIPVPALARTEYTLDQFLSEIAGVDRALAVIDVAKTRCGASIDDCAVEVATLELCGRTLQTVGIEAEDPERVRRTVRTLGLVGRPNVNYVSALKEMLDSRPVLAHERALGGALS